MRIVTALTATALSAGLVVTGVGVASASADALAQAPAAAQKGTVTLPPGGVLEQRVTRYCTRIPKLVERADKASIRLAGNADTKGSVARAKARQEKAQKAGHAKIAARLGRVVERRTERLAKLPTVKQNLAQAENECAGLKLPS